MEITEKQRRIIEDGATERPFSHPYNDNFEDGIYVDLVDGKPLFSSLDKFDSMCGWPSFSRPIEKDAVQENQDNSYGMQRIEIKSSNTHSHLGHVFTDGPKELGGIRYCINGGALRFVPISKMEEEGYGQLKKELFSK